MAVRMPANPVALALIERSGTPIAAPSANIATRPSIVDSSDAIKELGNVVDMILDAGRTYFGIESTIVDVTRKPYVMLRPGVYSPDDLKPFLGEIASDMCIMRGLSAGLLLAENIFLQASAESALAPRPYTVSVGKTTVPPPVMTLAAAFTTTGSGLF